MSQCTTGHDEKESPKADLPPQLDPLKELPNWVVWRWVLKPNAEKPTKPPFQCNGNFARNDDPATWTTYDKVVAARSKFHGIGFELKDTNLCALDLDDCRVPKTGEVEPWAV